ncbi:hypothetical protein OHA72_06175 [Dactylosporangium sp. NBC_01737]|uniref:WXG100 family type VII secretion target n=1 Tax=Dactylosporangium sp. NBC_01737 TaxID=2975959 RepID=UPI002E0E3A47|nr:hypothetical protein OHA72_06175 [Dactylosporangium sp. NBC_01737]
MADLVHYDYESMDNAYEDMKKTSDTMRQSCEDLTSDALRLLQSSAGAYADGYEAKVKKLNAHFEELNDQMTIRAKELQKRFDDMGQMDIKLGDGF